MLPDEIVRVALDDDVDAVRAAKLIDERRGIVEPIGCIRYGGAKPGYSHGAVIDLALLVL